ncbi:MAG TPA: ATP-binding protein [Terriglobia bacterium]|nr:ATP-binding protein [Terriglobia bacterium]
MEGTAAQASVGSVEPRAGTKPALHRVAAIYGGNGTGKTNLLKALEYMKSAVRNSQKIWPPDGPIPRDPFLLNAKSGNEPSFFEAELAVEDKSFRYAFTLTDQEILEERLDVSTEGRRQMLLRREGQNFAIGDDLAGDHQTAKRLTRRNSLFLSAAAAAKHPVLLPVYQAFAKQITCLPWNRFSLRRTTAEACQDKSLRPLIERMLREADPAIAGLSVRQEDLLRPLFESNDPRTYALLGELIGPLQKLLAAARGEAPGTADIFEKRPVLSLSHTSSDGADAALDQAHESDGVLALLELAVPVLQAIRTGGTVCVDEIGAGLHPLQALRILHLFNTPKLAGRPVQIIFTTLDTNLLTAASLQRDQIWFTEKDNEGCTHLYPLSDFMPERNENLRQGYLQGRYGPVPFIGWTNFIARLDSGASR